MRAQKSVFRLEIPLYFAFEEKELQQYLATGVLDLAGSADWHNNIRACCSRGVTWTRVKQLALPLSDYARFEYSHFWHNQRCGEEIRVVDEKAMAPFTRVHPWLRDFWLFDEAEGYFVNYTDDFDFKSCTRLSPAEVTVCTEVQRQMLAASMPMAAVPEILALQPTD